MPVDVSSGLVGAAQYAASLEGEFNSELVFVHALENGWPLSDAARDVRDVVMTVRGKHTKQVHHPRRRACPSPSRIGKTEGVDVILMPTRGVPILARLFERSTTVQILRTASCPVWAGVDDLSAFSRRPIRTILCCLSLGPRTGSVLRWAAGLARQPRVTLTVIHASKSLESMPAFPCDGEWRL